MYIYIYIYIYIYKYIYIYIYICVCIYIYIYLYIYAYFIFRLLNESNESSTYKDIEKGEKPENKTINKYTSSGSLIEMNNIRSNVFKVFECFNNRLENDLIIKI